jgi:radical SAM protein with 4Fe4S-binding SPASM domain
MTSAGGGTSICDNCNFLDEKMAFLRDETKKRGFPTVDGVHMGPCEIHRQHAHTIGPDGALYACPGFTGDPKLSTGHIDGRHDAWRAAAASRFEVLASWRECNDCAFIPVCAGGCSVAAHTELGNMKPAELPQVEFRSRCVCHSRAMPLAAKLQLLISGHSEETDHEERTERNGQEEGHAAPLAR